MSFNIFGKKKSVQPAKQLIQKSVVSNAAEREKTQQSQTDASGAFLVLRGTYVSERASHLMGMNQYVFKVSDKATKPEIKKQIEGMYKVKVEAVRIVRLPGKMKQIGRHQGFRPGAKKAIIRLAEGNVIEQAKP